MKQLPAPDLLESVPHGDAVCLVSDDGTPMTLALIDALGKKGWQHIVVLRLPTGLITPGKTQSGTARVVALKDTDETTLVETLKQIQETDGPIAAFIHLHPRRSFDLSAKERFADVEKQILQQVFLIAKHLARPLTEAASRQRAVFMSVTRINGRLGYQMDNDASPLAGGLNGLLKTANIEWEAVFCRAIDLSPEIKDSEAADRIVAEMSDSDSRITEVGYASTGRCTLTADTQSVATQVHLADARIDTSSVFLVSGGGKGVTAACVMELAKRYRCRFILLGRSEIPPGEPDWAKNCFDDTELKKRCMDAFIADGEKPTPMKIAARLRQIIAGRDINHTIREIKSAGSMVTYLSADINDGVTLAQKLKPVIAELGTITGIIHGAGVLADKLIENKTAAEFETVYATKISGLNSLLNVVSLEKLTYLVLFSSAAGFYGNEAQSDYAAANEILNKVSYSFKHHFPACHVIAYNWGPWDGGMVTPALKNLFLERQIEIIPVPVGTTMMVDGLSQDLADTAQVVIGSSMTTPRKLTSDLKSYRICRTLSPALNPFLQDHTIDGEPVLPLITAVSWMADSCARLYPGFQLHTFENAQVFKGIIFNDPADKPVFVDIKEIRKNETDGGVEFDVRIASRNPQGKPVFHYGSRVFLSRKRDTVQTLPELAIESVVEQPAAEYYTNGTLFHGPMFRNVTHLLQIDRNKLVLRCNTPASGEKNQGQFPLDGFNYFADDACLQGLLIWARQFYEAGSLPLKIQKGSFFRTVPFSIDFFITLTITESSQSKILATVISHDAKGAIYSRFEGAEAAISKNLNRKFKQSGNHPKTPANVPGRSPRS
ncbi:SDR family NAD(P)-dependent oxidoreductase [bacterium]|nr:SDR family NAD(P)-dependent oxidoreductase [bacterium]